MTAVNSKTVLAITNRALWRLKVVLEPEHVVYFVPRRSKLEFLCEDPSMALPLEMSPDGLRRVIVWVQSDVVAVLLDGVPAVECFE
ncbi:MAG TPA: hypothetical protein PK264_05325 [Hyphomicrobiaceae bacterium]|nr:hypothetical protein [Hyphomicrobiaceae bacterium]